LKIEKVKDRKKSIIVVINSWIRRERKIMTTTPINLKRWSIRGT
jgi:hypothetical protein